MRVSTFDSYLYFILMEERDFTVVARIRPRQQGTLDACARKKDDCHINIGEKVFNAHKIYGQECETAELFGDFINPSILAWVKSGATLNVLAYGQTASGKTFTISECLFLFGKLIFSSSEVEVQVSCFELTAGNVINDLLADKQSEPTKDTASYSVMEDMHGIVQVNTSKINVACLDHYEQLLHASLLKRTTSATTKNEESSRSHAIFRITFISGTGAGMINFVDLAGSERAASDSLNHSKDLMRQSIFINKTLMTLKECIRQRCLSSSPLSAGQSLHIPYRGSKLTLVLKDAFELESRRPCHTLFIATVSTMKIDLSASTNTMRYASALVITTKRMHRNALSNCDPKDISLWNHDQLLTWFQEKLGSLLKYPQVLFPNQESGFSMARVPEIEFINRICNACEPGKVGTKRARAIYIRFWGLVIAERTRARKALQNNWKKHVEKQKANELDFLQQMMNS